MLKQDLEAVRTHLGYVEDDMKELDSAPTLVNAEHMERGAREIAFGRRGRRR